MIDCVQAKIFEFVVAGFRFLKVRTCVDLVLLIYVTTIKIKHDRFVLESAVSNIYTYIYIYMYS